MSCLRTIFNDLLICPELENTTWVCLIRCCKRRFSDKISLDHNRVGAPFLASEEAVTMDELLWGTEEEVGRMYAAALIMHCKLSDSDVLIVGHEKMWLQDGKGLMACKSVSVVFTFTCSVH
jgi:hypothetical protein